MNQIRTLLLLTMMASSLSAQSPQETVERFFRAMNEADQVSLRSLVDTAATVQSTMLSDGQTVVHTTDMQSFIKSIAPFSAGDLDERICHVEVKKAGGLTHVWMDYSFYLKGAKSHCGSNSFTLIKQAEDWKVLHIADTRGSDCRCELDLPSIEEVLDRWHLAAAEADSAAYFSLMTPDAIYVGTDKTEVWSKDEFLRFAAPYFARGKAWSFQARSRNFYGDDKANHAWFDEVLDTWMGPCRGSGVMALTADGWRVQHYVLSVTVPNDYIQEFLKIYEK